MSFSQAISTCFSKYASFSGRASRSEYWWWFLFTWIVSAVLGWVPLVGPIFLLAVLLPSFAVAARRLHDTNRSGWWQLLPLGAAAVMGAVVAAIVPSDASTDMSYTMLIAIVITGVIELATTVLLIVWLASKGTAGNNRFGPDPLAQGLGEGDPGGTTDREEPSHPTVSRTR